MGRNEHRFAVILAGGDGSRLRSLTRTISGDERPKQFCPIIGGETLLDVTRRRVGLKVAPSNVFFSLTAKHDRFFRRSLKGVANSRLVVQPENKGTAAAILYSLFRLANANPEATVAFFPSDHYFSDDLVFMEKVEKAFQTVERDQSSIVLLGIEPDSAETSYGWIEPHDSFFGNLANAVTRVKRFWEKPARDTALELMTGGCLWNSFVMVGKVSAILKTIEARLLELYRLFAAAANTFGTRNETATVRSIYAWIDDVNFSSEVLEKSPEVLYVMRVSDITWSDWGEPQRVLGTLNDLGLKPDWMTAYAA
jgi:mannose-1-phosphate guanylyltransferase